MKTITTPKGKVLVDESAEIKEGDYIFSAAENRVIKTQYKVNDGFYNRIKIIATINHSISLDVPMVIVKRVYSEADLINYKRFWLAQDIEWFDNTDDGDIYKNRKGKVVTEKEIVTAYIQSLNQEHIELEMEEVYEGETLASASGFALKTKPVRTIKTTRGSNGQLMAYLKHANLA